MKNICKKCGQPKVTFIEGKDKAKGIYIPCGCKPPVKRIRKFVCDKAVMQGKEKFIREKVGDCDEGHPFFEDR